MVESRLGLAEKKGAREPMLWRDRRWNAPNQPVVGRQLLRGRGLLRLGWRAPAGGARVGGRCPRPGRLRYPWGGDWENGICNTTEARLDVTSPVGLFPRSRQAQLGIEDLAGNVEDWCANIYARSLKGNRALCGGAWFLDQNLAKCAARDWMDAPTGAELSAFVCCVRPTMDRRPPKLRPQRRLSSSRRGDLSGR